MALCPTTPRPEGWPRAGLALALAFVQALFVFGIGARLLVPNLLGPSLFGGPATFLMFVVIGSAQAALVLGGTRRFGGQTLRALGWTSRRIGVNVALGLGGALACIGLSAGAVATQGPEALADFGRGLLAIGAGPRFAFLCLGLGVAFSEETTFRGFLQPALIEKVGPALGLLFGALAFSLYHLDVRPLAFFNRVSLGLVLGALARAGGSLVAPALAHSLTWAVLGPA